MKTDGSPVAGPVNLKIDLAYTSAPATILCSQDFSSVALSNGVFHLKLDLLCPGPPVKTVSEILSAVPATFAAALRVSDVSNNKIYAFQEIHSMPFATISETAKQLAQLGAVNGEVLKWNDTTKKWEPGTPGGGGTVTNVTATSPLAVASGATTPALSITKANTTTDGYLSATDWNLFNNKVGVATGGTSLQFYRGDNSWQTLNTSAVPESGVTNLYFSNARVLGVPLDGFVAGPGVIVATDTVLQAFAKTQGQINSLTTDSAKYLIKNGTDSITGVVTVASPTGFLRLIDPPAIFTDATNMAYVDSRDDLKVNIAGDTMSGVLTLDNDLKMKGGANYVTLKAHATSAAYNLFLPQSAGTSGFVLSTDGNGNTTWINSANVANGTDTVTSASIVDGAIVDADINASAAIAQSKIANLSTDLAGKEPTVTNPSDTSKYYRGDKSWQTLNTTAVAEGSNLYFLNARVLAADLLGLNTGVAGPITAVDTVLGAFGKLQYQVTDLKAKGQWEKNVGDIYYNTGNVGIGTTTPGSALEVKGTLRLAGSTSGYVGLAPAAVAGATTYTLPAADGSAGQILKTNGAGILSWVTDNSGAGAFSGALNRAVTTDGAGALSTSSTTVTELGYVSGVTSSIQTQLNNKQSTTLASTNILVGNGSNVATAVAMSGDATLANTGAVTLKNTGTAGTYSSVTTDAQGRVTAGSNPVVVTSVTGSAPITIGGTAAVPVISMAAATTAVNGYLTATDWNTFNSKQAALSSGATINGIVYPANGAQTLQIPLAPVAFTDAVNKQYVDSFGQWGTSAGNVYRTTGNVGIGTTVPGSKLSIADGAADSTAYGTVQVTKPATDTKWTYANVISGTGVGGFGTVPNTGFHAIGRGNGPTAAGHQIIFRSDNVTTFTTADSERMRINASGNVGIGTITPQTKLDVNGAIRLGTDATACSAANAGAMKFETPNVEFCNGTAWTIFGVNGAAVASTQITDGTIVDADVNAAANITATKLGTGAVDNTEFNYLNGVTSAIQTQLDNKQPLDATLTSLAAYNTNGILVQTAANTFIGRSIAGTANRVSVSNGDGVLGNPTLNLDTTLLPSPLAGDVGKILKTTGANASAWSLLASSDVTGALGYTPVNKTGDSLTTGTIALSGAAALTVQNPVNLLDVANKQYVDSYGQWTKNASDIYRSTGNVGVGIAAPVSKLDVVSSTNQAMNVTRSFVGLTNTAGAFIGGTDTATSNTGIYVVQKDAAGLSSNGTFLLNVVHDSLSKMLVTGAGNVGIGTTTPAQKLSVAGTIESTSGGIKFPDGTVQTTASNASSTVNMNSVEFATVYSSASTSWIDVPGFSMTFTPTSTTSKVLIMANITAGMNGSTSGYYRILRNATPIAVPATVAGYISTTSSSFYGGSTDGNNNETSTTTYIDTPGTTSAVTYKVQMISPQGGTMVINGLGSDISGQVYSSRTRSTLIATENGIGAGGSQWNTSGLDLNYTTGNVGIGTTTPLAELHVEGEITSRGGSLILQRPVTAGGWARGLMFTPDGSVNPTASGLAGFGVYGTATTQESIFLTFGTSPWASATGIQILPSGNVGMGTLTPTSRLQVVGTTATDRLNVGGSGYGLVNVNVLNDNTAGYALHYPGVTAWQLGRRGGSFSIAKTGGAGADTMGTDFFSITQAGNIGIGMINAGYQLQLSTDSAAKPGTSTWTIASDERLKDIRAPFSRGLDAVEGINPIYFRYKEGNPLDLPSDKEYVGIKAQDAAKFVPEAVHKDEKGFLHVTNDAIIWTMLNGLKELYHRWTDDKALVHREIASVKSENAQLKANDLAKDKKIKQLEKENLEIAQRLKRLEQIVLKKK